MYEFRLSWFSWSSLGVLRLAKKIIVPLQSTLSLFGLFETGHYLTAASASALQNRWTNSGRWLFVLKLLTMHHWRVTATQLEWLAYTQSYLVSFLCQTQAAIQGNYDSSPDTFQFFCLIRHHPEAPGAREYDTSIYLIDWTVKSEEQYLCNNRGCSGKKSCLNKIEGFIILSFLFFAWCYQTFNSPDSKCPTSLKKHSDLFYFKKQQQKAESLVARLESDTSKCFGMKAKRIYSHLGKLAWHKCCQTPRSPEAGWPSLCSGLGRCGWATWF